MQRYLRKSRLSGDILLAAASAQRFNQRHGYDIDDTDGNHGCHGPEGVNLRTFLYVLGHGPAQVPYGMLTQV